jgi:hypothetical protein
MNDQERTLLEIIQHEEQGYIIGYKQGDTETLNHKKHHALYHLHTELRELAQTLYEQLPNDTRKVIECNLKARKYDQNVWIDEFQAYIACNIAEFGNKARKILPQAQFQLITLCDKSERKDKAQGNTQIAKKSSSKDYSVDSILNR